MHEKQRINKIKQYAQENLNMDTLFLIARLEQAIAKQSEIIKTCKDYLELTNPEIVDNFLSIIKQEFPEITTSVLDYE